MRKLITIIIILSVIDAAATIAGIELNYIIEANPFFASLVIKDPFMICTLACLLAVALILLIYHFRKKIRWIKYGLFMILTVKVAIVFLHLTILVLAIRRGYI